MAMYRPLREARYKSMRELGMCAFEARILSQLPRNIPYLKILVAERYKEFSRFIKRGGSEAEFRTHILRRYNAMGWRARDFNDPFTVWRMLKYFEKPYKEAHPEYVQKYPIKSHHSHTERTKTKLENSMRQDSAQELRQAIRTYQGTDAEYLKGVWKKKLADLEKRE